MLSPVVYWRKPEITSSLVPFYILKEILQNLAVLSKTLQQGELSLAGLPSAVSYCLAKLDDVLRRKDEILPTMSVDLSEDGKFGLAGIQITEASISFLSDLITNYVAKLKENITARFPSLPLVQAFSIFDLQRLPAKEAPEFKNYGVNHVATLGNHFWCQRLRGSLKPSSLSGNTSSLLLRI